MMKQKPLHLTDTGIEKVEKSFGIDNLYELEHQTLYHYMIQAVRAHVIFERDVDYIVRDEKIELVDMFTGRIMEGRTLSDGFTRQLKQKKDFQLLMKTKRKHKLRSKTISGCTQNFAV